MFQAKTFIWKLAETETKALGRAFEEGGSLVETSKLFLYFSIVASSTQVCYQILAHLHLSKQCYYILHFKERPQDSRQPLAFFLCLIL
jgi:hypothetical protein